MIQFVIMVLTAAAAAITAYFVLHIVVLPVNSGSGKFAGLDWLLDRAPAMDAFLMFIFQAVLVVTTVACALLRISNHIILSLDILYLLSILILFRFHMLKEACNPPVIHI